MGPIGLAFGIACAVVLVSAAFSRSRTAIAGALVLCVMWGVTKVFHCPSDSSEGLQIDAICSLLGGAFAVLALAVHGHWWLRVFTASMLASAFLTFAYAWSLHFGFAPPKWTYELSVNMLYGIAMLANFSPGLHHGGRVFRSFVSRRAHGRAGHGAASPQAREG